MKTLKELNSKWYWRLLKVTNYIAIATVMLLCIFIYSIFLSYNPKVFKEFEQTTKEVLDSIEKLKGIFPSEEIQAEQIHKEKITAKELYLLLAMGKNIRPMTFYTGKEGVIGIDKSKCIELLQDYLDGNIYGLNLNVCGIVNNKDSQKEIDKLEKYYLENTDIFEKAEIYKSISGKYIYRDYLGFGGIVKTIFSVLGLWVVVLMLAFGIKCIIYYIIFGKVFPPKGDISSEEINEKSTEKRGKFKKEKILYIFLGILILIFQLHEFFFSPNYWMFLNGGGPYIAGHILTTIILIIIGIILIKKGFNNKKNKTYKKTPE